MIKPFQLYSLKKESLLFKSLFSITLGVMVHFREFFPMGAAELLFLLSLSWLVLKNNSVNKQSLVFLALGLFITGIFIMSFIFIGHVGSEIRYIVILFINFVFFWMIINIKKFDIYSSLKLFIFISVIVSLLTIIAFFLFYLGNDSLKSLLYTRGWYARGQGFLINPNYYSVSMLFSFFAAFIVWRKRGWGGTYVLILLMGILVSLSRGAMLALFVFLIITSTKEKALRRLFYKVTSVALLIGIITVKSFSNFNLSNLGNALTSRFIDTGGGADYRLTSIQESMKFLSEGNYLIGIGRTNPVNVEMVIIQPHNTYVSALTDFGMIGTIAFLLFLGIILVRTVSFYKKSAIPIAIFFSLVAISITNDYQFVKEWWMAMAMIYIYINNK